MTLARETICAYVCNMDEAPPLRIKDARTTIGESLSDVSGRRSTRLEDDVPLADGEDPKDSVERNLRTAAR